MSPDQKSDGRKFLVRSSLVENIRFYLSKSAFSEPCLRAFSEPFNADDKSVFILERKWQNVK